MPLNEMAGAVFQLSEFESLVKAMIVSILTFVPLRDCAWCVYGVDVPLS